MKEGMLRVRLKLWKEPADAIVLDLACLVEEIVRRFCLRVTESFFFFFFFFLINKPQISFA